MLEYFTAHANREMALVVLLLLALGWCLPRFGERLLGPIERFFARLAENKGLAIFAVAAATALIRLGLLWKFPIPIPRVHDEFSYLVAADTFAHGRLTNPPHPMWIYFDTFHVNQIPTYMSKYPPGQGAVLALGQILGHPWIGVLLSISLMCGAVVWMLQGWLPPRWALLGGVLLMLRIGIFNYWINSYWGGAVAALGGALIVGALPRLLHSWRTRDSFILGLGTAILANSRPLEGMVFFLPVAVVLLVRVCDRQSPPWQTTFRKLILPFSAVMLLCGAFMAYYNWRGTGNPLLFPYTLNDRTYSSTPALVFLKEEPPRDGSNPQFDTFYNDWSRRQWKEGRADSPRHALRILWGDTKFMAFTFLMPELCIPLVTLPWLLRDRRIRFLIVQVLVSFAGFLLIAWFLPHYAAPVAGTMFAILTQGVRHLRRWQYLGRPVGIGLSRALVLSVVLLAPFHPPALQAAPRMEYRAAIASQLDRMPGDHLVIVRYSPNHSDGEEWVYNAAEIDRAKIVWAREIPGVSLQPLFDYFPRRDVWLVEPDRNIPHLLPYTKESN